MKHCSNCGSKVEQGSKFCGECGFALTGKQSAHKKGLREVNIVQIEKTDKTSKISVLILMPFLAYSVFLIISGNLKLFGNDVGSLIIGAIIFIVVMIIFSILGIRRWWIYG